MKNIQKFLFIVLFLFLSVYKLFRYAYGKLYNYIKFKFLQVFLNDLDLNYMNKILFYDLSLLMFQILLFGDNPHYDPQNPPSGSDSPDNNTSRDPNTSGADPEGDEPASIVSPNSSDEESSSSSSSSDNNPHQKLKNSDEESSSTGPLPESQQPLLENDELSNNTVDDVDDLESSSGSLESLNEKGEKMSNTDFINKLVSETGLSDEAKEQAIKKFPQWLVDKWQLLIDENSYKSKPPITRSFSADDLRLKSPSPHPFASSHNIPSSLPPASFPGFNKMSKMSIDFMEFINTKFSMLKSDFVFSFDSSVMNMLFTLAESLGGFIPEVSLILKFIKFMKMIVVISGLLWCIIKKFFK